MAALEHRTGTLDLASPCSRCHRPLARPPPPSVGPSGGCIPPLYLFPTGNAFHGACAAAEVVALVAPPQAARIQALLLRLSKVGRCRSQGCCWLLYVRFLPGVSSRIQYCERRGHDQLLMWLLCMSASVQVAGLP